MDKKEQAQLLNHENSIAKLEKVVTALVRRLAILEKEAIRNKHMVARLNSTIESLKHQIRND